MKGYLCAHIHYQNDSHSPYLSGAACLLCLFQCNTISLESFQCTTDTNIYKPKEKEKTAYSLVTWELTDLWGVQLIFPLSYVDSSLCVSTNNYEGHGQLHINIWVEPLFPPLSLLWVHGIILFFKKIKTTLTNLPPHFRRLSLPDLSKWFSCDYGIHINTDQPYFSLNAEGLRYCAIFHGPV